MLLARRFQIVRLHRVGHLLKNVSIFELGRLQEDVKVFQKQGLEGDRADHHYFVPVRVQETA